MRLLGPTPSPWVAMDCWGTLGGIPQSPFRHAYTHAWIIACVAAVSWATLQVPLDTSRHRPKRGQRCLPHPLCVWRRSCAGHDRMLGSPCLPDPSAQWCYLLLSSLVASLSSIDALISYPSLFGSGAAPARCIFKMSSRGGPVESQLLARITRLKVRVCPFFHSVRTRCRIRRSSCVHVGRGAHRAVPAAWVAS